MTNATATEGGQDIQLSKRLIDEALKGLLPDIVGLESPLFLSLLDRVVKLEEHKDVDVEDFIRNTRSTKSSAGCMHRVLIGSIDTHPDVWETRCGWHFGLKPHNRISKQAASLAPTNEKCDRCWPELSRGRAHATACGSDLVLGERTADAVVDASSDSS